MARDDRMQAPLEISAQGSFAAGGTKIKNPGVFDVSTMKPEGQTLHGDHAYAFYQIPKDARKLPMVFLHGNFQSKRSWESTPDGREGFQNIFLRRRFGVYLVDQPRRGEAGRASIPGEITAGCDDQMWFSIARIGIWPDFFEGVQFPRDTESMEQFFRLATPDTAAFDIEITSAGVAAVCDKAKNCILITHSKGGGTGWLTAIKSSSVKAIVAYEPISNFVFPEGETPEPEASSFGPIAASSIPLDDFLALTKVPIVLYYGDNIPKMPSQNPGQDMMRAGIIVAKRWVDTVNAHGGDATMIFLPERGIFGNTHSMFSDLNNLEVADLLSEWLAEKGLDR